MKVISPNHKPEELKVFIGIPRLGDEVHLFRSKGYKVVQTIEEADITVFTGGSDINPALYGEKPHDRTHFLPGRDRAELEMYRKSAGKFKIGLCRGGQLLNVLSGGKLWQDIDAHHGDHDIRDSLTGQLVNVTSIHHQAFRPGKNAVVVATTRLSTRKESEHARWIAGQQLRNDFHATDFEVLFYPETRSLCIQSHPEMGQKEELINYFYELIARYYSLPVPSDERRVQVG